MIPAMVSGMYMGEIIGFSLSGVLINWDLEMNGQYYGGWQSVFYVFGLSGILWFPYWALFAYESPDVHPKIQKDELDYIKSGKGYVSLRDVEDDNDKYRNVVVVDGQESNANGRNSRQPSGHQPTTHPLHSADPASPEFQHPYTSPLVEGTNPISRYSSVDRTTSADHRPHLGDTTEISFHTPLRSAPEPSRAASLLLDGEDREELAKRIPWRNFFTHPVALTFFFNGWTYVSRFLSSSSHPLAHPHCLFALVGLHRLHAALGDAVLPQRQPRLRHPVRRNSQCLPVHGAVHLVAGLRRDLRAPAAEPRLVGEQGAAGGAVHLVRGLYLVADYLLVHG
jgi:hypothetical protein